MLKQALERKERDCFKNLINERTDIKHLYIPRAPAGVKCFTFNQGKLIYQAYKTREIAYYVCVFICWRVCPLPFCSVNSNVEFFVHSGKVFLHFFNFSSICFCDVIDVNKLYSEKIKSNLDLYTITWYIDSYIQKHQGLPKCWERIFVIFPSLIVSQKPIHQHITESPLCL